jgi:hypothetical protein
VTAQGNPRVVFREALQRGNLLVAEATAREVGHIDLLEALELTALIARRDPRGARPPRVGAVVAAVARGSESHEMALSALREVYRAQTKR